MKTNDDYISCICSNCHDTRVINVKEIAYKDKYKIEFVSSVFNMDELYIENTFKVMFKCDNCGHDVQTNFTEIINNGNGNIYEIWRQIQFQTEPSRMKLRALVNEFVMR